jgi:hypothetical protein
MGLNPPFGVKAALANKFIDKALSFKPKFIVSFVLWYCQVRPEEDTL